MVAGDTARLVEADGSERTIPLAELRIDMRISVLAGEQVFVDSAISAAKAVTITAGAAGTDDNRLSIHVTTVGGVSAAGITSDNSRGVVTLQGTTDLQLTGNILSGGTMAQQFNADRKSVV